MQIGELSTGRVVSGAETPPLPGLVDRPVSGCLVPEVAVMPRSIEMLEEWADDPDQLEINAAKMVVDLTGELLEPGRRTAVVYIYGNDEDLLDDVLKKIFGIPMDSDDRDYKLGARKLGYARLLSSLVEIGGPDSLRPLTARVERLLNRSRLHVDPKENKLTLQILHDLAKRRLEDENSEAAVPDINTSQGTRFGKPAVADNVRFGAGFKTA